eukprot:jgi/Botrbrau1/4809/Bobra.0325s0029.1
MSHPWNYYLKVAALGFTLGAAMELFMIKTGFYDTVTRLEAERLEQSREDREKFKRMLLEELERQAREKNLKLRLPKEE